MPIHRQKQLLINNEWRPAASGKTMDVVNPATEEVIASVASAGRDGRRCGGGGGAGGARRTVGQDVGARARAARQPARRSADGERADEVARLETLHNGKPISESRHIEIPAAAECFEYYARLGRQGDGGDDPRQGQLPHLHAARADRRRRRHRAVEFSAAAGGVEGGAGAGVRQHRHPQAGEPDAADGAGARRDRDRGRACRRAC